MVGWESSLPDMYNKCYKTSWFDVLEIILATVDRQRNPRVFRGYVNPSERLYMPTYGTYILSHSYIALCKVIIEIFANEIGAIFIVIPRTINVQTFHINNAPNHTNMEYRG